MEELRGITVKVPVDLHSKVKAEQEAEMLTMNQYIQRILEEHFLKGGEKMETGKTRTLAFQVSEELFLRVKEYLARYPKLSQKDFVIGLIEDALDAADAAASESRDTHEDEPRNGDPSDEDEDGSSDEDEDEDGPSDEDEGDQYGGQDSEI